MSASVEQLEAAYQAALADYKLAAERLQRAKTAARPERVIRGERCDIAEFLYQRSVPLEEIATLLKVDLQDVKYWVLPYERAVAEDEAYQRYLAKYPEREAV